MRGKYAALAEGWFAGVGELSSLGKAGLDEKGNLKPIACFSIENARKRAIWTLLNKLRNRRWGTQNWIERPELELLEPELFESLVDEINACVEWVEFTPSVFRAIVHEHQIEHVLAEA